MTQDIVVQCTLTDGIGGEKIWIDGCCTDDSQDVPVSDSLSGDSETDGVCVECFDAVKFNDRDGASIDPISTTHISGDDWREMEDDGLVTAQLTVLMVAAELTMSAQRMTPAP